MKKKFVILSLLSIFFMMSCSKKTETVEKVAVNDNTNNVSVESVSEIETDIDIIEEPEIEESEIEESEIEEPKMNEVLVKEDNITINEDVVKKEEPKQKEVKNEKIIEIENNEISSIENEASMKDEKVVQTPIKETNEESEKIVEANPIEDETLEEFADKLAKKEAEESSKTIEVKVEEPKVEEPKIVDITPPAAVTRLSGYYNGAKNEIIISWTEPDDADYAYSEIFLNNTKVGKAEKGITTYKLDAETLGYYTPSVISYDTSNNAGPKTDCSVEAAFFNSMSMPLTGVKGKGQPVVATITGKNFKAKGVTPKDFKVTCDDSSVSRKAEVEIVNDNKIRVTLSIPKFANTYTVNVKCGNNIVSGTLKTIDVPEFGTVKKTADGKPVAIIVGYNSLGLSYGVALDEVKGEEWATSYGVDKQFKDIMCTPSELGVNSAIKATISGDIDGLDNWEYICKTDPKCISGGNINQKYVKAAYPLFYYAMHYGDSLSGEYKDGWYIPSLSELCTICQNKDKINEIITLLGVGTPIGDEFYWSSSQCDEENNKACAVKFSSKSIYKYYLKTNAIHARCVKMIY